MCGGDVSVLVVALAPRNVLSMARQTLTAVCSRSRAPVHSKGIQHMSAASSFRIIAAHGAVGWNSA